MKKLINLLFLLGLITIFIASSCNKPNPEPALPTGENIAYYYLDGQLVIPTGYTSGVTYVKPIGYSRCSSQNSKVDINFQNSTERLYIYFLNGIQNTGIVYLTTSNSGWDLCENINNIGMLKIRNTIESKYYYTQNNSGTVNITYLSENKRQFKGTFQMDVYDANGVVIHITGGHFNINLDTL